MQEIKNSPLPLVLPFMGREPASGRFYNYADSLPQAAVSCPGTYSAKATRLAASSTLTLTVP